MHNNRHILWANDVNLNLIQALSSPNSSSTNIYSCKDQLLDIDNTFVCLETFQSILCKVTQVSTRLRLSNVFIKNSKPFAIGNQSNTWSSIFKQIGCSITVLRLHSNMSNLSMAQFLYRTSMQRLILKISASIKRTYCNRAFLSEQI